MLISDERDNDVFFDSMDCLTSPQETLLTEQEFGYEIWVNEPMSVKERRKRFLQGMGLVDASSKVCSHEKMTTKSDAPSVSSGLERIMESSGAVSNAEQVPQELVPLGREATSEARVLFNESKGCLEDKPNRELRHMEVESLEEFCNFEIGMKKKIKWWKHFISSRKRGGAKMRSKLNRETGKTCRINVKQNKKRWMELSALYVGQEIRAHKGLIWTMKFSPDGQYLASGGEDGVIRIWCVTSLKASSICFAAGESDVSKVRRDVSFNRKKHLSQSFAVLPNKIFKIEELPLQEFHGHSSDVLDLAWSNSDTLLSSSMDKTVRLWRIGCNQCQSVFHHKDYVTCIQFNPVDENYFISGSIDGKVRIWGIHEERVVDWADVRDVISAIGYRPDGKGFVVGSLTGVCRFYVASGKIFQLEAQIHVSGKKRTSGNKITSIQFSQNHHNRVMITSEDSKVRILEGNELVHIYKGLSKSGSQMSGSFTSSGKHIISVGEDSRVYIWNFNDTGNASSKQTKSERSCEHFYSKGITAAIPWSTQQRDSGSDFACHSSELQHLLEAAPGSRDSDRFSFGRLFSIDGTCRGSMTWPEEKLPSWDLPIAEVEFDHQQPCHDICSLGTWGLSIVAATCEGTIKTFHNFGLPVRL